MKLAILIPAIAACAAFSSTGYAYDQVDGSVNVMGHVQGSCAVLTGGSPSTAFSGTIDLGELAGLDGKLDPGLHGATIAGASQSFTVMCNTMTPHVTLSATTMLGDAATAPAGFTKTVDYTAKLDLVQADSSTKTLTYLTFGNPAATTGDLTSPLSGTLDNITVSVNTLTTNGNFLASGQYGQAGGGSGGVITITITPAVAN